MQATATVQADNERTIVTEWRFQPGQSTGYHRHSYDYVIVPLTTGKLRLTGPDGETIGDLVAGHSYFRDAGAEHDVTNINDYEFAFIEVEFKDGGPK